MTSRPLPAANQSQTRGITPRPKHFPQARAGYKTQRRTRDIRPSNTTSTSAPATFNAERAKRPSSSRHCSLPVAESSPPADRRDILEQQHRKGTATHLRHIRLRSFIACMAIAVEESASVCRSIPRPASAAQVTCRTAPEAAANHHLQCATAEHCRTQLHSLCGSSSRPIINSISTTPIRQSAE